MSILPWEADRNLSRDDALGAIRAEFPQLHVHRLNHLGSGWDYDAYSADDTWTFRFPRRAEVAERRHRERAILDFVRPIVRQFTRVPEIHLEGNPNPWFPYHFIGHRMIAGVRADDPTVTYTAPLSGQLGKVLACLHSTAPATARAARIEVERESCLERYEEAARDVEDLPSYGGIVDQPVAWLMNRPAIPLEYNGIPRLLHNDLCPDHILVQPEDGSLTGLIDWSDTSLGDPALDFVVLVLWRGWEFADAVLAAYSLEIDRHFVQRLAFLGRVLSLHWLAEAEKRHGDVEKHLRWLANAFGDDRT